MKPEVVEDPSYIDSVGKDETKTEKHLKPIEIIQMLRGVKSGTKNSSH